MVTLATPARRLDAPARRLQLIEAGLVLADSILLSQISADDVARVAGVSKGLVFHYFPSQKDLHAAILSAAVAEMLTLLDVNPNLPPAQRLTSGIDAFIGFIERQPMSYLALARGSGADPQLQVIFEYTRASVVAIIAGAIGMDALPAGLRIAIRGWIAMVEETVLHWLDEDRPIPRNELIAFLQHVAVRMLPEALAISTGMPLPER